jgi:hypothetical protein
MDYQVAERSHRYGRTRALEVTDTDLLVADIYEDQYSVNWSTRLSADQFLSLWKRWGAEKARTVITTASVDSPHMEGYGYQLFSLNESGELDRLGVKLVRLWLDDVSVAWQVVPAFPPGELDSRAVVGFASNVRDLDFFERYFEETATPSLMQERKSIRDDLTRLSGFPEITIYYGE